MYISCHPFLFASVVLLCTLCLFCQKGTEANCDPFYSEEADGTLRTLVICIACLQCNQLASAALFNHAFIHCLHIDSLSRDDTLFRSLHIYALFHA